jgi:Gluconate 2-dehydrogenase subunit 3
MQRREALNKVALLLGGAFSGPTLLAIERWESQMPLQNNGFRLSTEEQGLLAALTEMIVPRTDTPGAIDAGVPAFVDMMVRDCYYPREQAEFSQGLQDLASLGFMQKTTDEKREILMQLQKAHKPLMKAYGEEMARRGNPIFVPDRPVLPFWRMLKELTLLGYFTSEQGIKANFEYHPTPGKFQATKLKPGQKFIVY